MRVNSTVFTQFAALGGLNSAVHCSGARCRNINSMCLKFEKSRDTTVATSVCFFVFCFSSDRFFLNLSGLKDRIDFIVVCNTYHAQQNVKSESPLREKKHQNHNDEDVRNTNATVVSATNKQPYTRVIVIAPSLCCVLR